jgi:hypothetical protein
MGVRKREEWVAGTELIAGHWSASTFGGAVKMLFGRGFACLTWVSCFPQSVLQAGTRAVQNIKDK